MLTTDDSKTWPLLYPYVASEGAIIQIHPWGIQTGLDSLAPSAHRASRMGATCCGPDVNCLRLGVTLEISCFLDHFHH